MAFYKKFDRAAPNKGGFGPKKQGGGPNKGRSQNKARPEERGHEGERPASYSKSYAATDSISWEMSTPVMR